MCVLFIMNINLGSADLSFASFWDAISSLDPDASKRNYIILNYRIPKAIAAILVGSGLAVSGLLMQTLFRNPLAGPYVLGLSSGASLGVALLILGASVFGGVLGTLLISKWSLIIASSIGSFLVLMAVLTVSTRVKDTMAILIIGLMFAGITSSVVSILSYFSDSEQLKQYVLWSLGSLGNMLWSEILIFTFIYLIGIIISISTIKALNSLLLGEQYAKSLGVNVKRARILIISATSLLAGTITAFAGPIAFIGLAVPHLTKLIFNTANHKVLIPAVMLSGAILMLMCDIIAQVPNSVTTFPINAVTALVGAPVVIWLLVRKRKLFV